MAKTIDTTAQKERQRKIMLAVLGVVLLLVLALQGPKLLDQLNGDSSTPAAAPADDGSTVAPGTTIVPGTTTGESTAGSATPTTTVPAGVPRAVLVGVTVGGGAKVVPGQGQLRRFTLFSAKDPFVQQLPKEPVASPAATPATGGAPSGGSGATSGGSGSGSSETASKPSPLAYATISVNGDAEALTLKGVFPAQEKLFVLKSLKGKTAKIAVYGGAFTDGQTITLKLGKNLTLVNTATGARYALKLLYVGDEPEQVEGFVTTPAAEPATEAEPKK